MVLHNGRCGYQAMGSSLGRWEKDRVTCSAFVMKRGVAGQWCFPYQDVLPLTTTLAPQSTMQSSTKTFALINMDVESLPKLREVVGHATPSHTSTIQALRRKLMGLNSVLVMYKGAPGSDIIVNITTDVSPQRLVAHYNYRHGEPDHPKRMQRRAWWVFNDKLQNRWGKPHRVAPPTRLDDGCVHMLHIQFARDAICFGVDGVILDIRPCSFPTPGVRSKPTIRVDIGGVSDCKTWSMDPKTARNAFLGKREYNRVEWKLEFDKFKLRTETRTLLLRNPCFVGDDGSVVKLEVQKEDVGPMKEIFRLHGGEFWVQKETGNKERAPNWCVQFTDVGTRKRFQGMLQSTVAWSLVNASIRNVLSSSLVDQLKRQPRGEIVFRGVLSIEDHKLGVLR